MRVLHVSDLHFGGNEIGLGPYLKSKAWGAKAHARDAATRLATAATAAERTGGKFDLLIATGDLSTDGSRRALQTVRSFLEQDHCGEIDYRVNIGKSDRLLWGAPGGSITGLNAQGRVIAIPGNHDRYGRFGGQVQWNKFEACFEKPPNWLPYSYVHRDSQHQALAVFVALDSTRIENPGFWRSLFSGPGGFRDRATRVANAWAEGLLTKDSFDFLESIRSQLEEGKVVSTLTGREFKVADRRRVAVLVAMHHHATPPSDGSTNLAKARRFGWKRVYKLFLHDGITELRNAEELRKAAAEMGVSAVLFGHQHKCYQVLDQAPPLYFCCPASTGEPTRDSIGDWKQEVVEAEPGFMSYELGLNEADEYGIVSATYHRLERGSFVARQVHL